jgi:hypothetical protein
MPLRIAIVCEAPADYLTATALAERVLCEEVDWLQDVLPHCPLWWGLDQQAGFLCWKDVPTLARERNIKSRGTSKEKQRRRMLMLRGVPCACSKLFTRISMAFS